jgi:very-short-patch-repair endonuclease
VYEEVVARQHGVLTRRQAHECGLTDEQIEARLRGGRWQRLLGPVYATYTGVPPRRAQLWAVVLRAGKGAVLSHETAAELAGLLDQNSAPVHVTLPADRRIASIPGVVLHTSARAEQARHPIRRPPQTRIEETVLDLTQRAPTLDEALGWVATACGRRFTTPERILTAMNQRRRVRWRAELVAALRDVEAGCHSLLELRYLRDVERRHGLPVAARQVVMIRRGGRWYDDVRYAEYHTRVELDGRAAHPDQARWRDARRDNAAVVEGDTVLRYGWTDVAESSCALAAQVGTILRRNGWTGSPRPCGPDCVIAKENPCWGTENRSS